MKIETKQVPAKTYDVQKQVVTYVTQTVTLEPAREDYTLTLTRDELFALRGLGSYYKAVAEFRVTKLGGRPTDGPVDAKAYAQVLEKLWYASNPVFIPELVVGK